MQCNSLCGDCLHLTLRLDDGQIIDVDWGEEGCATSLASASLLGTRLVGMSLDEACCLRKADIDDLLGMVSLLITIRLSKKTHQR